MDINHLLPKEIEGKFRFKDSIPGPSFTEREAKTKKTVWEFDVSTLTLKQCEDLLSRKFPYIEAVTSTKADKTATGKE